MRKDIAATPPKATRMLAKLLPAPLRFLACGGVHTIAGDYGPCVVCGRDWTGKGNRKWLRFYGERTPESPRRREPSRTSLHIHVTPKLSLHRNQRLFTGRSWNVSWVYKGDYRSANLRPEISFSYRNISKQTRAEQQEREWNAEMERQEQLEENANV
jgi:hypothetical protein